MDVADVIRRAMMDGMRGGGAPGKLPKSRIGYTHLKGKTVFSNDVYVKMKQAMQQWSTKDRMEKKLGGNDEEGGDDDEPLSDIVAGMRDPHIADMMVAHLLESTEMFANFVDVNKDFIAKRLLLDEGDRATEIYKWYSQEIKERSKIIKRVREHQEVKKMQEAMQSPDSEEHRASSEIMTQIMRMPCDAEDNEGDVNIQDVIEIARAPAESDGDEAESDDDEAESDDDESDVVLEIYDNTGEAAAADPSPLVEGGGQSRLR